MLINFYILHINYPSYKCVYLQYNLHLKLNVCFVNNEQPVHFLSSYIGLSLIKARRKQNM